MKAEVLADVVAGRPAAFIAEQARGVCQGRRRTTLMYPVLDRARRVLWVVTGGDKTAMLSRLCDGDAALPAGRVRQDTALLFADQAVAGRRRQEA